MGGQDRKIRVKSTFSGAQFLHISWRGAKRLGGGYECDPSNLRAIWTDHKQLFSFPAFPYAVPWPGVPPAHYFDWCPEAVVLLHAATHRILKGNRFFHHGVGPLASVAGQHVLPQGRPG